MLAAASQGYADLVSAGHNPLQSRHALLHEVPNQERQHSNDQQRQHGANATNAAAFAACGSTGTGGLVQLQEHTQSTCTPVSCGKGSSAAQGKQAPMSSTAGQQHRCNFQDSHHLAPK